MKNQLKNKQEIRFLLVGGANTLLDFSILFGLKFLGINEIIANIFSTGVSFIFSFFMNKKFTFESVHNNKKELLREMILFSVITLFGLWVIQSAIIKLISDNFNFELFNLNLTLFIAKIIATIFSLIWNFILYNF